MHINITPESVVILDGSLTPILILSVTEAVELSDLLHETLTKIAGVDDSFAMSSDPYGELSGLPPEGRLERPTERQRRIHGSIVADLNEYMAGKMDYTKKMEFIWEAWLKYSGRSAALLTAERILAIQNAAEWFTVEEVELFLAFKAEEVDLPELFGDHESAMLMYGDITSGQEPFACYGLGPDPVS